MVMDAVIGDGKLQAQKGPAQGEAKGHYGKCSLGGEVVHQVYVSAAQRAHDAILNSPINVRGAYPL